MVIACILSGLFAAAPVRFAGVPASVRISTAAQAAPVVYVNRQYGFRLSLPHSWKGYTVLTNDGQAIDTTVDPDTVPAPPKQRFTVITIRHPAWTKANPWEDLPIMIFTLAQWKRVENEELAVGAAPIPPSQLSRNERYVFALPARYNFDYSAGWQELERILKTHPLQGF